MSNNKIDLKGLVLPELEEIMLSWGEKPYRARQLMLWIYHKRVSSFEQMTDISKSFRNKLDELAYISSNKFIAKEESVIDNTTKYLFELNDGEKIESVLMYDSDRVTCCVSTQIGCNQGCAFCATGASGYVRNLSSSEIINQVMNIDSELGEGKSITNVVLMGMGEPFCNYDNVMRAIRLMNGPEGLMIAARKITISTSGLVPQIKRFIGEGTQVGLAISLNATDDEIRSKLMPINRKYPIAEALDACKEWAVTINRWLTVEYILIKDLNDSSENARQLVRLLHGIPSKVNLIIYNPVNGLPFKRPGSEKVERFRQILADAHFVAPIRESKGIDISAACGQLRAKRKELVN